MLRDFNSHALWHPAIAKSEIEDAHPADMVGAVRAFSLADGGRLREQLLRLNDRDHELTYACGPVGAYPGAPGPNAAI